MEDTKDYEERGHRIRGPPASAGEPSQLQPGLLAVRQQFGPVDLRVRLAPAHLKVWGLECRIWDLGFRVQSLGFKVQGLAFRV